MSVSRHSCRFCSVLLDLFNVGHDLLCKYQDHTESVCSAVTCHLHIWQRDRGLLLATAVTRGWNRYRNKREKK